MFSAQLCFLILIKLFFYNFYLTSFARNLIFESQELTIQNQQSIEGQLMKYF